MANHQVVNAPEIGYVDKRRTTSPSIGGTSVASPANNASITTLRARLTAISGTTYTAARLDTMTLNDMQYAVRVSDDPTGI